MTEAKLYDRSFSEGYETGFAGRACECPYIASEAMFDAEQWHAGYLYGQHVAMMQHRHPHSSSDFLKTAASRAVDLWTMWALRDAYARRRP
ncbi:hypothetical protein VSR68_08780 [Paraburkholderia phymatum]|uniref:hypothetical protein n=1 Tax=Paraburkholderia phymatum TaxID=148447 RepID=UPI0031705BC7